MPVVIVGGVLEKDNKYLLVQEAKEKAKEKRRGQWSLPAGKLDPNETIFEGTKREIKEESGLDVELSGVCQIGNRKLDNDSFVSVIFSAKVINGDIHFDPDEILDVRWFSYEEILSMKESLREEHMILGAISNVRKNLVAPISLVEIYDQMP